MAHTILARIHLYRAEYDQAEKHLDRAMELNPNDAQTLAHACVAFALMGEPALGLEAGEQALRLDPYYPDWYAASLGSNRIATGHYVRTSHTAAGEFRLLKGVDANKDQSYFLQAVPFEQLAKTLA